MNQSEGPFNNFQLSNVHKIHVVLHITALLDMNRNKMREYTDL